MTILKQAGKSKNTTLTGVCGFETEPLLEVEKQPWMIWTETRRKERKLETHNRESRPEAWLMTSSTDKRWN